MPETDKKQITAKLPNDLYILLVKAVEERRYDSQTDAVVIALEEELNYPGSKTSRIKKLEDELEKIRLNYLELNNKFELIKTEKEAFQMLIPEKENIILLLNRHLSEREKTFETLHNFSLFLQSQMPARLPEPDANFSEMDPPASEKINITQSDPDNKKEKNKKNFLERCEEAWNALFQ